MTPKADFFSGIGIAIFAAVFFILAGTYPEAEGYGLGPGGFPKIVTGTMFVLGVALSINSYVVAKRGAAEDKRLTLPELTSVLMLAAAFLAYTFVIKYLGYIITTLVFLFLFMFLYGDRKWKRMGVVSVLGTAITFVLFKYLFLIYLPTFQLF